MDVPSGEPPESPTIASAPFAAARDPLGSSTNADENSAISRSFSTAPQPSSATSAGASSDGLGANSGFGAAHSRNWSGGSASGAGAGAGEGETTELAASDGASRSPRSPLRPPGDMPVSAAVGRWRGDVEVQRTRVYNQHVLLN